MEAFASAVNRWGVDMLEMDVRLTRDGEVVVFHDPTVDRTTDGTGPVSDYSLADLLELDAGARFVDPDGSSSFAGCGVKVPRFEDVLLAFPRTRINVEAKSRESARPLVDLILRHGAADRVLVAAEHERNRQDVRGYPGAWGASRSQLIPFHILLKTPFAVFYTPRVDVLQLPDVWKGRQVLTPRIVLEAHRRNIPVHVWTINEVADMARVLDWGVDGIQTDRPDRLARVLHERVGRPLPPGWQS